MKKVAGLLLFLTGLASSSGAQTVTADLARGQDAYEKSNVELAKTIFAGIIASKQQVTPEQKVTAYKYLGAYWALQSSPGARDSANSFFIAALDYDPFTDLDRVKFAADEQSAFGRAKMLIFKVGIQPVDWKALDPQSANVDSSRYTFRLVSTHNARLGVELVNLADPTKKETFPSIGNNDGVRDIPWNGLINTQRADTGLYELRVTATDNLKQGPQIVESHKFRIDHSHAPLEDTLPAFKDVEAGGIDTLKSAYPGLLPLSDGAKGLFVGAVAGLLPYLVLSQRDAMSGWGSHWGIGITLGAAAGGTAAWYATSHRADATAVSENARRRQLRAQFNAGVMARNRARIDKTILIVRPLTSASVGG